MEKKSIIRNPGCSFCRYFHPSFSFYEKTTESVCIYSSRRVIQKKPNFKKPYAWLWVECDKPQVKNENQYCSDFQIKYLFQNIIEEIKQKIMYLGLQYPPALKGEKWWKT